jgi:hypothetical protein
MEVVFSDPRRALVDPRRAPADPRSARGALMICPSRIPWLGFAAMPLTSASSALSRVATVFDFLPALARRHLASRIGARGGVHVFASAAGVFTLVHQYREGCASELCESRFAQLRVTGSGGYQLYWKKGNGRWTAYSAPGAEPFVGSIDECLAEIARDPFGCYWSS